MYKEYRVLKESEKLKGFIRFINILPSTGKRKLLGIGISDSITLKYYAELDKADDVLQSDFFHISTANSFKLYSTHQAREYESSLAIGIKISKDTVTKYFHVKVTPGTIIPNYESQLWFFKILKIDPITLPIGISGEIQQTNCRACIPPLKLKSYYYLRTPETVERFIAFKRLNVDPLLVDHIEMYATDTDFKYNLIFKEADTEVAMSVLTEREKQIVKDLQPEINRPILYAGRTAKEATVYYSLTNNSTL